MSSTERRGRCRPCKTVWVWPTKEMRLKDAHCPNCGRSLVQTAFMNGRPPQGATVKEIETPDTYEIAVSRFGYRMAGPRPLENETKRSIEKQAIDLAQETGFRWEVILAGLQGTPMIVRRDPETGYYVNHAGLRVDKHFDERSWPIGVAGPLGIRSFSWPY